MKELKTIAINILFLRIALPKILYIFQEKHSHEIAFLSKVAGCLALTGNVLLGNLHNFKNSFHKKHP